MANLYDLPSKPVTAIAYIRRDGTYVRVVHMSGRYIRLDGTYVGTVHTSEWYMILVYCTATVIAQIKVDRGSKYICTLQNTHKINTFVQSIPLDLSTRINVDAHFIMSLGA